VKEVLEKLDPEPFKGKAKYYVEFRGRRYPIKADPAGRHRPSQGLIHDNARLQGLEGAWL